MWSSVGVMRMIGPTRSKEISPKPQIEIISINIPYSSWRS
jgi:hypothetical protein